MKSFLFVFTSFVLMLFATDIPTSDRAQKAITENKPKLIKLHQQAGLEFGEPIFIRIFKQEKELEVWVKKNTEFKLLKTYPICHFSGDLGPKTKQGDNQAPEGFYYVKPSQMNPWSSYHLSFNLGYPNNYDKSHGRTGDLLMVHGNCVSIGCYAMTDKLIEEIYTLAHCALEKGQPLFRVHCFPFRMNSSNMNKYQESSHYEFWENLKIGYDWFEKKRKPPNVEVKNKMYIFND